MTAHSDKTAHYLAGVEAESGYRNTACRRRGLRGNFADELVDGAEVLRVVRTWAHTQCVACLKRKPKLSPAMARLLLAYHNGSTFAGNVATRSALYSRGLVKRGSSELTYDGKVEAKALIERRGK